jgi:3D (Asp-Asp-Asp) domain-containing protein
MFKKYKKQLAIFGAVATLGFGGFNYVQHVAEAKALSREAKQIQEQNAVMIENLRKELEQAKQDNNKLKQENETLRQQNEELEIEKKKRLANTFRMEATAYTDSGRCANGFNLTGLSHSEAMTIAVDPNVIPLGSKVKVTFDDPQWNFLNGIYTANDTGGAIKGTGIIDVFLGDGNEYEAMQFGRRMCTVTVL